MSEETIRYWVSRFRSLKDWTVSYDPVAEYKGQCAINEKEKSATIYDWGNLCPMASDYFLHEVLHIAYRASKCLGRNGEEEFVQDQCALISLVVPVGQGENKMEPLENQLFKWKEWDGDHECMVYYNPVLKVQIGKHPAGTKFDSASILFDKGVLQLENYGPEIVEGHVRRREAIYTAEYKLNLTVGEVIKE